MKKLKTATLLAAGTAIEAGVYKLTADYTKDKLYRHIVIREDLSAYNCQLIRLKSSRDLILCGYLFEKEGADATLIMLHGFKEDASYLIDAMDYFMTMMNANVLLLDASAHGISDGYIIHFGYHDVIDLMQWNRYLLKRYSNEHKIIIYGQGMGANTMLNAAGMGKLKNVRCLISNGAYADVTSYLTYHAQKEIKLPPLITAPIIRWTILNDTNEDIKKMNTVAYVRSNMIPTLFIHAQNNPDVPLKHVFKLYNANASEKDLFITKEAHFYDMNPDEEYTKVLPEFIKEYL